ncbi:hypothetical protein CCACVL1_27948 [Corchorus capsularis]|uniref:Uncharacterized protein n=1 Tax=Corchorus capsularis TaxID=210143 RepID=A0A1R3G849_COCAP|nr:hypothetical protein CCACVL1_27948 [Corchorus capsularis]
MAVTRERDRREKNVVNNLPPIIEWEERAASPRPATPYRQGIHTPSSPLCFEAFFQASSSTTTLPTQDEHHMQSFQDDVNPVAPVPTSFEAFDASKNPKAVVNKDKRCRKRRKEIKEEESVEIGLDKNEGVAFSSTAGAFDASLSKDQRYRLRLKEKQKFKDEEIDRLSSELKAKNKECASLKEKEQFKDEEIVRLHSELEAKNEECESVKEKEHFKEDQIKRQQEEIARILSELEAKNEECASLKEREQFKEYQIKRQLEEIAWILSELEAKKEECASLKEKVKDKDEALEHLTDEAFRAIYP